ncbi:DUF7114 family protein [Haloarchaeobius sp. HRN-SO-5]|uniref:DUF7114 family protein n=1 Tax=Haloarchaeobius sp. HRN-SO-5 TaxID=3446118 RepID=UPI003EBA5268
MDEAATCRRAACEALADIYPDRLRDDIADRLAASSMAPGVVTIRCALACDDDTDVATVADRAAGVQLIYDGLRLTRSLAHEEPWADTDDQTQANLDSLAATVLVSRGFYLLARTDAAAKAVGTVRDFGRDQTRRREPGADTAVLDASLERDVLELAALAGTTAVGATPTTDLFAQLGALVATDGSEALPPVEALPAATELQTGATASETAGRTDDHVRQSATDS